MDLKIDEVTNHIRTHYARVRSVREIAADEFGQNYEMFRKEFRRVVGTSPMKYLRQVRAEHAKDLLRNTTLKHYAIGREVGYKNEVTFCRFFKREAGMTPKAYRQSNGQNSDKQP